MTQIQWRMPEIHLQVVAGLANRLRALVSGICLAEDCKVNLIVHWVKEPACGTHFESLFDSTSLPSFVTVTSTPLLKYYECLSPANMEFAKSYWDRSKPLLLKSYGHFHSDDMTRWLIHLRRLRAVSEISTLLQQRLPPVDPSSFLGVHIRCGDNVKAIQASPLNKFIERLEKEKDKVFVVATDDLVVRKTLIEKFPGQVWFTSRILDRQSEEGMKDAFIDFLALASCKHIVGSAHSSFNEIACLYGECLLERIT